MFSSEESSSRRRRFVQERVYGIQAAKDVTLWEVGRALNEDPELIQTEKRLSRNLAQEALIRPRLMTLPALQGAIVTHPAAFSRPDPRYDENRKAQPRTDDPIDIGTIRCKNGKSRPANISKRAKLNRILKATIT